MPFASSASPAHDPAPAPSGRHPAPSSAAGPPRSLRPGRPPQGRRGGRGLDDAPVRARGSEGSLGTAVDTGDCEDIWVGVPRGQPQWDHGEPCDRGTLWWMKSISSRQHSQPICVEKCGYTCGSMGPSGAGYSCGWALCLIGQSVGTIDGELMVGVLDLKYSVVEGQA